MATLALLTGTEKDKFGFTHRITYDYADIAALTSGTAYSLLQPTTAAASATTLPAKTRVADALMVIETAFTNSGADNGTLVAEVGIGGATASIIPQTTLKTAAMIEQTWASVPKSLNAADTVDVIFTAGTQAITTVNAGKVHFFLKLVPVADALTIPSK